MLVHFQPQKAGWISSRAKKKLHHVKNTGEKASADHESAWAFPAEFNALIAQKGYTLLYLITCVYVLYILLLYHVFRGLLGEKYVSLKNPGIH